MNSRAATSGRPFNATIRAALLTMFFVTALGAAGAEQNVGAWIAMARIHNGNQPSGPGVYLGSGMIITAAHIVNPTEELKREPWRGEHTRQDFEARCF